MATSIPAASGALDRTPLSYLPGFGNHFQTEAIEGALPRSQNSPQHCPLGLYAEQLSGTSFTSPRHLGRRSWLYRIRPAVAHGAFKIFFRDDLASVSESAPCPPDQLRWGPRQIPDQPMDFFEGLSLVGGNGSAHRHEGCAIYVYVANRSMQDRYLYSADGEWLIVPQQGVLRLSTELGRLDVGPLEVAIIPRGIRFRVDILEGPCRGYICENYGLPFKLPDLGPIGSNGLASPRDFLAPTAWFEDYERPSDLFAKFAGRWWVAPMNHSPLDVVAWHGNNAPCKYDLRRFNTMGSVSFDHPDPSIFLVLHSPTAVEGVSNLDFVIFPPRWLVMENTFRPPWFHRNIASEFMGLIQGTYDAKAEGFVPGGYSLHNCMSGHGPDSGTVTKALNADTTVPQRVSETMAFMFESRVPIVPTAAMLESAARHRDYQKCWADLPKRFGKDV